MMVERLCLQREKFFWVAMVLALAWLNGLPLTAAHAQGKTSAASTRIRLATPTAALSYLPIYVALQKGFFAKRGFDMEVIQMAAGLAAPALLNWRSTIRRYRACPPPPGRAERRSKSFASHR